MCYDVVSETALPYLSDLLHLYIPSCSLHSSADAHTFWMPKRKKNFQGQCTFSHLGPVTWDKLPYSVCYAATKSQFKTQNHTISLSSWTKLLNFFCCHCQSYHHQPHFLLTCLSWSMRAAHVPVCVRTCMCVCTCVVC